VSHVRTLETYRITRAIEDHSGVIDYLGVDNNCFGVSKTHPGGLDTHLGAVDVHSEVVEDHLVS
jgi:hypothetical protein